MKKIFIAVNMFFVFAVTTFPSCTKTVDTALNGANSVLTPINLAGDPVFIGLNDALNRFDPHYLQLVYGDVRTTEEIRDSAQKLIAKLQAHPNSELLQKELAGFYKFNSIEELKFCSDQITVNAAAIKHKYLKNKKNFSDQELQNYFKARSIYAKRKMDSISNNTTHYKANSMYDDYVLFPEPPAFTFFGDMDLEDADAGGDGDCSEACCIKLGICKRDAYRNYSNALFNNSINGAVGGITAGTVLGSVVPVVGAAVGAIGGGLYLSVLGVKLAIDTYQIDMGNCLMAYKLCLTSGRG